MANVLKVDPQLRMTLLTNDVKLYEQIVAPEQSDYTLLSSDRLVLPAAMGAPQQANLGDIGVANPGTHLLVESDRQIKIGINSSMILVDAEAMQLIGASITSLFFQNTDPTNEAVLTYVVVKSAS